MTNAKVPAGGSGADGFTPLDLEQFRRGFVLFLAVLSGQEKAPRPPATYRDPDTGRVLPLEDSIFNRAWLAAGKFFEDEVLRLSFYRRLELFGSIARDPRYDGYIGFCRPSLHMDLVAALARVPFNGGMTEKACVAAFDEELRRQTGVRAQGLPGQGPTGTGRAEEVRERDRHDGLNCRRVSLAPTARYQPERERQGSAFIGGHHTTGGTT